MRTKQTNMETGTGRLALSKSRKSRSQARKSLESGHKKTVSQDGAWVVQKATKGYPSCFLFFKAKRTPTRPPNPPPPTPRAGGFQLFVQMLMRRRILARFFVLCSETLAFFSGVLAVLSALRGRAGADCDCASFQFWRDGNDDDPDAVNHHPTSVVMIIITKTRTKTNPSHAPPLWRKGLADIYIYTHMFICVYMYTLVGSPL